MIRAPLWLIGLLLLAAIGVGVYAYFTTPLPLGLSSMVRTPGGGTVALTPPANQTSTAVTARAAVGQPLLLGAASVRVQSVLRNQDLTAADRGGPPGLFTLLDMQLQNAGGEPLTPALTDFRLIDDQGRVYAVDTEATRAMNAFAHRRNLVDASLPPGGTVATFLAFETSSDTTPLTLRVTLGYGEMELPRT